MLQRSPGASSEGDDIRGAGLPADFESHLRESALIERGDSILVATSGGLDSMALLSLLAGIRQSWRLTLYAAHFDHRIRPESREEAEWVADQCAAWEIPFELGVASSELRGQAAAREARYQFLARTARALEIDRIATGHHADDQAETVLFRISRGTGLHGLAGIPARRGRIVRPLLPFWLEEIEEFATATELPFLEDPSNIEPAYARNRLRLEVLPLLEEIVPGTSRSLVRLAEAAAANAEGWATILEEIEPEIIIEDDGRELVLARGPLLAYHPRIRGLLIRKLLRELGGYPDRAATDAILAFLTSGRSGGEIEVAGGVRIAREFDHFRLSRVREGHGARGRGGERALRIPGPGSGAGLAVLGGDRQLRVQWGWEGEVEPVNSAAFDPAAVRFPLEIRGWRPGDRIQLPYGTKKLKKLFVENRVGRADRARVPILAEVGGRVLWVVGIARAVIAMPLPGEPAIHLVVTDTES